MMLARPYPDRLAAGLLLVPLRPAHDPHRQPTRFRPARKAHPAFVVEDFGALRDRLAAGGFPIRDDADRSGVRRFFTDDPWGNRIEFVAVDTGEGNIQLYDTGDHRISGMQQLSARDSATAIQMTGIRGPFRLFYRGLIISKYADSGECQMCVQTIEIFVSSFGAEAGNREIEQDVAWQVPVFLSLRNLRCEMFEGGIKGRRALSNQHAAHDLSMPRHLYLPNRLMLTTALWSKPFFQSQGLDRRREAAKLVDHPLLRP